VSWTGNLWSSEVRRRCDEVGVPRRWGMPWLSRARRPERSEEHLRARVAEVADRGSVAAPTPAPPHTGVIRSVGDADPRGVVG